MWSGAQWVVRLCQYTFLTSSAICHGNSFIIHKFGKGWLHCLWCHDHFDLSKNLMNTPILFSISKDYKNVRYKLNFSHTIRICIKISWKTHNNQICPVFVLTSLLLFFTQALVSLRRLERFLNRDELDTDIFSNNCSCNSDDWSFIPVQLNVF